MIITIGGLAGTGTTTAAEILSKKLDIPYISAGSIFREMAKEKGMSVLEFSEFAEGNDDIDKEIDKRQAELAKSSKNLQASYTCRDKPRQNDWRLFSRCCMGCVAKEVFLW